MRFLILSLSCLLVTQLADAQTFDILETHINLQVDIDNEQITGTCSHSIFLDNNPDEIQLMLEDELTVDSIIIDNNTVNFTHSGQNLDIDIDGIGTGSDTLLIHISYHGSPPDDPSGFGGFYFRNGYAFNMGVGFSVKPHSYGRAWFPCVDDFREKYLLSFSVETEKDEKALCNGTLTDTSHTQNSIIWNYELRQPIPAYLTSVAVGDYEILEDVYSGKNGNEIPLRYGIYPGDSTRLSNSFRNIDQAIEAFEDHYGEHRFDLIGYVTVPFSSGAMEHASNIAYPKTFVNGNLNGESLYAHELSHHWWGDLVTCETAEDMWINEGWASYSESLFMEKVYGRQSYLDYNKNVLNTVLRFAHIVDTGFYPVSPVPHSITYGMHVYQKGSLMAHSLRAYMGDSLFFSSINKLMKRAAWGNVNSYQLRDSLSAYSGMNLTDFFDNWIFQPGFSHFDIERYDVIETFPATVKMKIRQKLREANTLYEEVPLEVLIVGSNFETKREQVIVSGSVTEVEVKVEFEPRFVILDDQGLISDARIIDRQMIKESGTYDFNDYQQLRMVVNSVEDSAMVALTHHWVYADPFISNPGIRISDYHYWSFDGVWEELDADLIYRFDAPALIDHTLEIDNEDSLVMLYKRYPYMDWEVVEDAEVNEVGNPNDGRGFITIPSARPGYYALGMRDFEIAGIPDSHKINDYRIYPNPANNTLQMNDRLVNDAQSVWIVNVQGMVVAGAPGENKYSSGTIPIEAISPGQYFLKVEKKNGLLITLPFIKQ